MFGKFEKLINRTILYEVGIYGKVTEKELNLAKKRNYRPLNKFEKWLMKPVIEYEREWRQKVWREARKGKQFTD